MEGKLMAIKFFNIKSRETLVADSEPKIAALWASSDHSPNITQGQDFGWRLAPAVAVELKRIKQDYNMLERIAQRFGKLIEDIGEPDILTYISNRTALEAAPVADVADYQDEYDAQVRALEQAGKKPAEVEDSTEPTTTTTTTEVPPSTTTTTTQKV
jgi:hypothetical protein